MVPPDSYLLGRSYRIETIMGTIFTGTLVSMSLTNLEFDAQEMGHISLAYSQVRRADLLGPPVAGRNPGYFDIGNGNRLFFAPTGRGLRKGENSLQAVSLYFVGGNFGLTDNVSLGGYVSLIPGIGLEQSVSGPHAQGQLPREREGAFRGSGRSTCAFRASTAASTNPTARVLATAPPPTARPTIT